MSLPGTGRKIFRFGAFELAAATGELRKNGLRLKLQDQPVKILILLLENAGEVVTREQIQKQLWPEGVYVDYENAINSAVRKLREALIDTSDNPRFVETLPRRGYRFAAPVTEVLMEVSADANGTGAAPCPQPEVLPQPLARKPWRPVLLLAGTLAAVLALGWWGLWFRGMARPETNLTAVPLTTYPGYESNPGFSPDGSRIAFSWNGEEGNNYDIYVQLIGAGKPLRLTNDPAPDRFPAASPDGRVIAFAREEAPGEKAPIPTVPALVNPFIGRNPDKPTERTTILTVPALGGPEREVTRLNMAGVSLQGWSPDGKWLLISVKKEGLFLVSAENGEQRVIKHCRHCFGGPGDIYGGSISPDGQTLAFFEREDLVAGNLAEVGDIYVLPLTPDFMASGESKRLTSDRSPVGGLAWTADSREIVFSSARSGSAALWRLAVSGSGVPRRMAVGDSARSVAISARASRLVYEQQVPPDSNIWRLDLSRPTSQPTSLVASTKLDSSPRYSPDGRRIVFLSNRSGRSEIWTCAADGSNPSQLTNLRNSGSPSWSPDGRQVVFDSLVDGRWQIFVVGSHGGQPRQLTHLSGFRAAWSHDGKWIYFVSDSSGRTEVSKLPADGGTVMQLSKNGGMDPMESADGAALYYRSGSWIMKVGVDGGVETRLFDTEDSVVTFFVAQDGIYYARVSQESGLRFYSFRSATSTWLLKSPKLWWSWIGLAPDGHSLLFTQLDGQPGTDLMLVDNFR